ncbi:MAG: methyltransferase domain-containing protein [Candidatus Rokubacteria bacterium]|nr:methyltransferase domain-containing protein [Candidatus Rokubacteria bacterium]
MTGVGPTCEWPGYILESFEFTDFPAGSRVLDVGFGDGDQMRALRARGCRATGIEFDPSLARGGRAAGLTVCRASADDLPFATGTFDGVICKVVIPYTDEARAIAEIARVLRPGGLARVSFHGLGYKLRYVLAHPDWKRRVYGARVIANTAVYALTGRRLPGFWGDTLYQSERRLRRYYADAGLDVVSSPARGFLGAPVFIYHTLRKRP